MARSQRLRAKEMRAVFRLLSDVREMRHDRPALHQYLADMLVKLVGADCGYTGEMSGWRPAAVERRRPEDLRFHWMTPSQQGADQVARIARAMAANNNLWDDATFEPVLRRHTMADADSFARLSAGENWRPRYPLFAQVTRDSRHVDHLVGWHHKGCDALGAPSGDISGVSLHRYGKGKRLFEGREIALVKLLYEELQWMHATGRLSPSPTGADDLPPRLKEVLDLLLLGQAPKQIAHTLNLSVHTVREHIQRLYDRFEVAGREELSAKFLRMRGTMS
jgi:DNA-binding CsgD family transcriptional regulator